ncbi:hypothetical protein O181_087623 [Austropuccinia psidii MF-1]|uniref:Retroviral polymerase SH3-like domain-containing protein n=1 Tax=Austropuccinia psidii MF-1 TaxID=1389203 RepID=A0A9Q3P1G0_9BASI|nr:hypothetical protein [Austropuccinia psidii MF-1]
MAQNSLLAANLNAELWPFAFKHTAWIYNCTLHSNSRLIPHEIFSKKKLSLLPLRTFGAKWYIHDHNHHKDLSARGIMGYHLVMAPDSKGCLFWIPDLRRIVKAASVKFDDNSFFLNNRLNAENVLSIQAENLFDSSMVRELELQELFISAINDTHDPLHTVPTTYKEAISSDEQEEWKEAIREEFEIMKHKNVFESVSLKETLKNVPHNSILRTKWVSVKKSKPQH